MRAGIEPTDAGAAALRCRRRRRRCTSDTLGPARGGLEGVQRAGGGAGRTAAVAAVRGAADRPGRCRPPAARRPGCCAASPSPMCRRRRNFVCLRKIAGGSRADAALVRLRRFPPGHAWRRPSAPSPADLRRQREAVRRPAAAALCAAASWRPRARCSAPAAADELLGAAFTAAAVRRRRLKDYRILHFATHALLPAELRCQSEPAIVTSDPPGAPDARARC